MHTPEFYICHNPKCPRFNQQQEREWTPTEHWQKFGRKEVMCLSCGHTVEYVEPDS
jgi:transcription initiation factor IIE alpha subunit